MIDQAVDAVEINMHIEGTKNGVWSLRRDYANALREAGYVKIIKEKPYIAIKHILERHKPVWLYQNMLDIITRRKNKGFHKRNFDGFVQKPEV